MFGKTLNGVAARPELMILALMVMIISMLVIPLPTILVDFLIGLNIVIAILVFMGSFYIERVLQFSAFPSILLITTLFRLALSISTSRLILIEADAGEIIASFGQFVIGDSLAVGFVIFSIVTIVQFIVITKGSERVAEVAARFSLDGMPGKQMSIDSDLKAGIIDADGARDRRSVLERESQLFGSFDGSMKFIKGDAIAGIVIILVNFIGGIAVGMSTHGMDMSTALSTYTMLTIGDGLVAQIPALLIAISAGLIVTRVNGEDNNLGRIIMRQLLGNSFVLLVTAVLALAIGLLPGFPFPVFAVLAALLSGLYFVRSRRAKREAAKSADKAGEGKDGAGEEEGLSGLGMMGDTDRMTAETVPLILLVAPQRLAQLEQAKLGERFRSQYFIDYGGKLPDIALRGADTVADNRAVLVINEIRAAELIVHFDLLRVVNYAEEIEHMGIEPVMEETDGVVSAWVRPDDKETLGALNYQLRPAFDELYQCVAAVLARNVNEHFGVQETKHMLDKLEEKYPDLLKEVYRHTPLQRVAELLQRLLSERISIRNMKLIMEALVQWAPREKDVLMLVEHVRGALARYICHKFAVGNELRAVVISPEIEETVRKGVRQTSAGSFLNLEPAVSEDLLDRIAVTLGQISLAHKDIVLLTAVDVRRFVKKLIETRFREVEVLSFGEITDSVSVNVIQTV
jgi:type III secretion protein V